MFRHPGTKGVWLFAMLGLLFAGVPRWEIHQHADAEAHHAFEPFSHEHVGEPHATDATPDVDDGVTVTHCHAAPSIAAAIFPSNLLSLETALLKSDVFPEPETVLAANAGPPPQRPPIV